MNLRKNVWSRYETNKQTLDSHVERLDNDIH